jgi:serine/threonine protein kinase
MTPSIIADRYQVERAVGRGGMGTVWLCTDRVLGREVAVKQIGHLPGESTTDTARALREARSAAALNHPNVVSIFDAIEEDDHIWLVMEYVPGRSLSELLTEEGRLEPGRVAWIGAQVADGLSAAHLRGTTHRDVKPANILVGANDHAQISDFGIARTVGDSQLTQTGMVTGTPGYFSPQLARGADPSTADDVWALGATLFAATEGHPPYPSERNALAQLSLIATTAPPRPERAGALTDVIEKMMASEPSERLTMADVAFHLHQITDQGGITGTQERAALLASPLLVEPEPDPHPTVAEEPSTPLTPATRAEADHTRHRRRWPLVLLGVSAAVIVSIGAWAFLTDDPVQQEPTASVERSSEASPRRTANSPEAGTTSAPEESSPSEDRSVSTDSAEQFVTDYYALLPDNTDSAWALLSPEMQAAIGSVGDYEAFWNTVASVQVDDTTSAGVNSVDVTLTYVTENGSEQETRRIEVAEQGEGFAIVGDAVVS